MNYYLALQTTYEQLEIGLFKKNQLIEQVKEGKKQASKLIIEHLNAVLANHAVELADLSFIAVNQGPAPFTSLRVVIATVNGLAFASQIPLVGVDGLAAFMNQYQSSEWSITIGLLNAFNNDVYFAITQPNTPLQTGCKNIETFLEELKQQFPDQQLCFIGNGTALFQKEITDAFAANAFIPEPLPEYVSLSAIGTLATAQWEQRITSTQLLPLYLKRLRYKPSIAV